MPEPTSAPPRGLVAVLVLCAVVVSIMQTLVVPLLPDLPDLLSTSPANASWVVTVTLLTGALATPVAGRLGDMYGHRRVLLAALGALTAGSAICALSDSLVPMVAGRALQGLSFGVLSIAIGIMREELPPERLGQAVGFLTATGGSGYAFGLPVAALVVQTADYHMLFWGATVLGLLCAGAVLAVVPARPGSRGRGAGGGGGRFDVVGALGLTAGLGAILLVISKGRDWGWTTPAVWGPAAGGVVVLALWTMWELRVREPLVDLRRATGRQLLTINLATLVVGFGMYVQSLVFPQVMQIPEATGYGLGLSLVATGLFLAPVGFVTMVVAPMSARLSRARGPRTSLIAGVVALCAAYLAAPHLLGSPWHILAATVMVCVGIGLSFAAMPALVIAAVPPEDTGAAAGLNSLMRSAGTSIGAAVTGMVLADGSRDFGDGLRAPAESAFVTTLWIGLGGCVLGLVLALLIPRRLCAAGGDAARTGPVAAEAGPVRAEAPRRTRISAHRAASGASGRPSSGRPSAGADLSRDRPPGRA